MSPERLGLVPTGLGQRNVRAPGVLAALAPLRLAVAQEPDLMLPLSHGTPSAAPSSARRVEAHRGPRGDLAPGAQRLEEGHERIHLGGREVLAVRRHVPAPLQDLADELIPREPRRHAVERRPALAAAPVQAMAGAALLVLDHQ